MNKKYIGIAGYVLAFLSIIGTYICLIGPGVQQFLNIEGGSIEVTARLAGFISGNHSIEGTLHQFGYPSVGVVTYSNGFIGTFAIVSLVTTSLMTLLLIVGLYTKQKKILWTCVFGFLCSGISIFLLKTNGTSGMSQTLNPETGQIATEFGSYTEYLSGTTLGLGTIFYGILSFLTVISILIGLAFYKIDNPKIIHKNPLATEKDTAIEIDKNEDLSK